MCVLFGLIMTEVMHRTMASMIGAALCLIVLANQNRPPSLSQVVGWMDHGTLGLLWGMMLIVGITMRTGVFEWTGVMACKLSKGDKTKLLLLLCAVTGVLSAFLDNVTTVILVAPITILVGQILGLPVMLFLVLQAIASNIGGTATLIGDPPNVLIGSQAGLTFMDFIRNLAPVVIIIMVIVFPAITFLFRRQLQVSPEARSSIMRAKPELAILDHTLLRRSLIVSACILLGFFLHHALDIEPGLIALGGAVVMCLVCGKDMHHALEKVEWGSIFFFVGLFMMVGALEYNGIFERIGLFILGVTNNDFLLTLMAVLWFAAIMSAIVDNIPLVIAMIPLMKTIIPVFALQQGIDMASPEAHTLVAMPLYWALALGACLGGNGTLIGASANVVVVQIARRNRYPISFAMFTAYGFPIMIVTLIISTVYIYFRYV